ncbi:unnamed protein product [Sphagnum troendelagicum]|uniref:Uncharacterized protein n=1 Tax=Sphagnum troendelagicum TaxID=128251 RepID=A0ABP0TJ54_9BRYO
MEPILPVLDTTETTDSRVPTGTNFTGSGHGEKADSRIRNRTGFELCYKTWFGWNLNYASGRNFEPCTSPNNNAVPDFVE